ncbi:MAG: FtsQ-type POTRA domain-containing protein [Armatimonadetes bacterium]|nr:FtsQ-type POTRA domain-containing protein [Armatimonadota bacterium]
MPKAAPQKPRIPRRHRRNRRKPDYFLLRLICLLATLIGGAAYYLLTAPYFEIRSVRITGCHLLKPEQMAKRAAIPTGANIFKVSLGRAADRLMAEPMVGRVSLRRSLPGTIAIDITERVSALTLRLDGRYYEADAGGVLCRPVKTPDPRKPYIEYRGREPLAVGEPFRSPGLRAALECAGFAARKKVFPLQKIEVDQNDNICLNMNKGPKIKLGRFPQLNFKLAVLETVWRDRRVREQSEYVDLTVPDKPARRPITTQTPAAVRKPLG